MNQPLPLPAFADLLKEEIRKSPYEIGEVLQKAGIPKTYLSRWKREDVRAPTYIEITYLANILGKPVEYFIYGKLPQPHVKIPVKEYKRLLQKIKSLAEENLEKIEGYTI